MLLERLARFLLNKALREETNAGTTAFISQRVTVKFTQSSFEAFQHNQMLIELIRFLSFL